MLEKRKEKYVVYSSAVTEHRKATSALHDLKTKGGRVAMSRLHAAENTIAQAKVKMSSAKDALRVVDQRVSAEIEKFKSQKMVDFREIVLSYVMFEREARGFQLYRSFIYHTQRSNVRKTRTPSLEHRYVQQQVEYQKRSEAAWRKLIPKLESAVEASTNADDTGGDEKKEEKEEDGVEGDAV